MENDVKNNVRNSDRISDLCHATFLILRNSTDHIIKGQAINVNLTPKHDGFWIIQFFGGKLLDLLSVD